MSRLRPYFLPIFFALLALVVAVAVVARIRSYNEFVARALSRNEGNRTRTACELGVTRQALVAKIRRLGL